MVTRAVKAMLPIMNLTDEAVDVVVTHNCQGLITNNGFTKVNEKSVEGFFG